MGLFDDLKMATGLGLEPTEAYQRAFEKGVLLGAAKFDDASEMFRTAAEKLRSVDAVMAQRANANALVYGFLAKRDPRVAWEAAQVLKTLPQIEVPGTADEVMEGSRLAAELQARMLEAQAESARGREAAQAFRSAANAWLAMPRERPVTFALTGDDSFADDGLTRFFYDAALAELREAEVWESTDPDEAAERLAMAALAFGRCGAAELRKQARDRLRGVRLERPCWFCGRRVRGLGTNLLRLPSIASAYFARLDHADQASGESYDPAGGVFACAACASAIDSVAEQRADVVRRELDARARELHNEMERLEDRVRRVESKSHSHMGGS